MRSAAATFLLALLLTGVSGIGWGKPAAPTESECRPFIEKAIKELTPESQEAVEVSPSANQPSDDDALKEISKKGAESNEGDEVVVTNESAEERDGGVSEIEGDINKTSTEDTSVASKEDSESKEDDGSKEGGDNQNTEETKGDSTNYTDKKLGTQSIVEQSSGIEEVSDESNESAESKETAKQEESEESEIKADDAGAESDSTEDDDKAKGSSNEEERDKGMKDGSDSNENTESNEGETSKEESAENKEKEKDSSDMDTKEDLSNENDTKEDESKETTEGALTEGNSKEENKTEESKEGESKEGNDTKSAEESSEKKQDSLKIEITENEMPGQEDVEVEGSTEEKGDSSEEASPEEEDLTIALHIPDHLRPRDHLAQILRLDSQSADTEQRLGKNMDITLRELKRLYDNAIKPLEILYKYRDLSNRHFGDPEIFSKPLILFMGPWSGGKSTIINYLLDNEYTKTALRTGAEPSPAYFNILMWGEQEEVLDGTQLAADWTFSGLQKFGQGLLDRLRGLKLNNPLLEKVNIVEIPGILEIRKQVERMFPFNDACQWFIDRADIIFLVYDPSKLDVGPETEAILDQLKGREYQTRIVLNKADQVRPEELMRVQGTLIWNISPLMSSTEPPVMYSASLWSAPYEAGAPTRLLQAQERALLKDLRDSIDKRVENKIASARRFAVRVRNHAKMVDCYLTTYYNHKSIFGNRKKVAEDIIEHPQNYHIYEGLSTLTNISRYDLPDPDVYRDFFRLNAIYEFQQLSATCTYFRGCPINRLDVAIAYDLPELVGKYKKAAENVQATQTLPKS